MISKKLKDKLLSLPTTSGVYIMKDQSNNVIYVGKAKNLKRRVNSYFIGNDKPIKTFNLVQNIADFDYILTPSDTDAFLLENNLIKKYQPHFNILLKDGKNYPYIKIDLKEDFPKLEITRKVKNDGAKYFGPYFNGITPDEILKIVSRAFSIRKCNLKLKEGQKLARPCLNHSLGLCSAPCAGYISKAEYKKAVNDVINFLKGDIKQVKEILYQKMELASQTENFEKAIEIRDEIKSLNNLKQRYETQFPKLFSQDVVGYYNSGTNCCITILIIRHGKLMGAENFALTNLQDFEDVASTFLTQYYMNREIPKNIVLPAKIADLSDFEQYLTQKSGKNIKIIIPEKGKNKRLVNLAVSNGKEYLEKSLGIIKTKEMKTVGAIERLGNLLKLPSTPYRIECYDISHVGGTNSVASMVVFLNGEPAKKHYRKFNIKTVEGNDDFASMQEVLTRRLNELANSKDQSFSSKPNLIVLDGGKGQLSSVLEVWKQKTVDIPLCSLAKQDEEIFVPNQSESVKLSKNDVALQVLQRIRDEAHKFAITFHRSKRSKNMIKSKLDEVKGIGKVKKQLLFDKFGSIESIKNASIKELMLINGITESQATEILKVLKNN